MDVTSASVASSQTPRIELGWLLVGRFDAVDRQAVMKARKALEQRLGRTFPRFDWRMPIVEANEMPLPGREEPTRLLEQGVAERDVRHWDFVLVVTAADLISHDKPETVATPSRALAVAVLSTARLDPRSTGTQVPADERVEIVARRLVQVALHVFGHLAGAEHVESRRCVMRLPRQIDDLDEDLDYCPEVNEQLDDDLMAVADERLEETSPRSRRRSLGFSLRAVGLNAGPILKALRHMKPWLFPVRLSKLTTAAVSTLLVLATTAEAWEVAAANEPGVLAVVSLVVLLATSAYLTRRQRLVLGQLGQRTEQGVVTEVTVRVAVFAGMTTTFVALFVLTLILGSLLYPPAMVQGWVSSSGAGLPAEGVYLRVATLVATLGLVIGALGASFEHPSYLRHVAYVDEEV